MRRVGLSVLLCLGGLSCGSSELDRPLPIEIKGLSSRADTLVLALFPKEAGLSCTTITLGTVSQLDPPYRAVWARNSGAERTLEIPSLKTEGVTIVAYSLDPSGVALQLVCQTIDYKDLGGSLLEGSNGVLVLTLSRRVTV